ncbi:MAG: HEAT repeat domain-containing protein [Bryobacteraceae bacterium]
MPFAKDQRLRRTRGYWNRALLIGPLLYAIPLLFGPGAATRSLQNLLDTADAVVLAEISRASATPQLLTLDLAIAKSYKGGLNTGSVISAEWTVPPGMWPTGSGLSSLTMTGSGIFFLARKGQQWTLIPPVSGFINPFSTYLPFTRPPATHSSPALAAFSIHDQLLDLIIDATEQGLRKPGGPPVSLDWELRSSPEPAFTHLVRKLASSTNPRWRAIANAARIERGDPELLATMDREQANLPPELKTPDAFEALRHRLDSRSDPVVATLGRIATAPTAERELRIACAYALARSGNLRALPLLAQLLDSPDLGIRAAALSGFSAIVNDIDPATHHPRNRPSAFRTEETMTHTGFGEPAIAPRETSLLGFWKSWWAANRSRLPAGP